MGMSKPEKLTTQAVSKIETRFRRLHLGFRGRTEGWNIDRQQNVHAHIPAGRGDIKKQGVQIAPPRFFAGLRRCA